MTGKVILRRPSSNRRKPLITRDPPQKVGIQFGELAGGTAAECAAVCCCCPCGLMNLFVLAVYKLPAGLCRKALKKKHRKQLMNAGLLSQRKTCPCGCEETELQIKPMAVEILKVENSKKLEDDELLELMELEKEMWDRFYGTGFWRSPSQRESER